MFEELLPNCAEVVETRDSDAEDTLFAVEAEAIKRAVEKRRREFKIGRSCAHRALHRLTGQVSAVPSGCKREPLWPDGVVGSITHCDGLAAAAVARQRHLAGIGIDAEPNTALSLQILPLVCSETESAWARDQADGIPGGKILFCAKEAAYKCLFPITRLFLEFGDVEISFPSVGRFSAKILRGPITEISGRWLVSEGHVAAAAILDRGSLPGE